MLARANAVRIAVTTSKANRVEIPRISDSTTTAPTVATAKSTVHALIVTLRGVGTASRIRSA